MMKKIFSPRVGLALVIAMVALTPFALAERGKGKGKHGGDIDAKIERLTKELNLTDAQKTQIRNISDQFKTQHEAQFQEIKSLRMKMKDLRKSDSKDQTQMTQLRTEMKGKMEALKADKERMMEQIKAVLTAEQRTKLEQLKAERKLKHEGKKEGRRGKKGGRGDNATSGDAEIK